MFIQESYLQVKWEKKKWEEEKIGLKNDKIEEKTILLKININNLIIKGYFLNAFSNIIIFKLTHGLQKFK